MEPRRSRRKPVLAAVALVVVAVGALSYSRYRPAILRARSRVTQAGRIVSSPCGPIEYAESGSGPAVLIAHGAGGGFDQGLALGHELVRAGFRVIAPSRFGYLGTPMPADASTQAQAGAFACLLDALDLPSAAIMGVSAGGPSAVQFALRFPDRTRALVLLVPAVYAPHPSGAAPPRASRITLLLFDTALRSDFLFWAASKMARPLMIRAILGTPPELVANAPPEEQARIQTFLDDILPVSQKRAGLVNDARTVSSLPRYALEKVGVPTLAVSTVDDGYGTFAGARYTSEHIAGARFIGYPTGGHMLVGRNAAVSTEIIAFMRLAADR